jgi:hypothetical protein
MLRFAHTATSAAAVGHRQLPDTPRCDHAIAVTLAVGGFRARANMAATSIWASLEATLTACTMMKPNCICPAPSTSQRPCKRAFILPLMTCHSFHLAQSPSPRLVRVLAQHGPTPILRAAGTALATGTLLLISLWVSGLIHSFFLFVLTFVSLYSRSSPACTRYACACLPEPACARLPAVRNGLSPSVSHSHLAPSTPQCPSKRAFIAFTS